MELARDRLAKTELHRATLLATIYAPDEALRAGYLDEVVPADELMARAKAEAARLGALPNGAVQRDEGAAARRDDRAHPRLARARHGVDHDAPTK